MNIRAETLRHAAAMPTTAEEFLRWNETQERKYDWVAGRVVEMMVRVSRAHALLCNRLMTALARTLVFPPYTVSSADFGVRTERSVRYPDVMVDGQTADLRDLAAAEPLLIAEVLSPSSMATDFGPKAREYLTVSSLRYYLILAQDGASAWLWNRGTDGAWPEEPLLIDGLDQTIDLPDLQLMLAMSELYAGIVSRRE